MTVKKEMEQLKRSSMEMLNALEIDTPIEQKVVKMIYGFIRAGFRECEVRKGGAKA